MKRSGIDLLVIISILEAAKIEINKGSLVSRADLNFRRADKYLNLLQEQGLVENRSGKYISSDRGHKYLEKAKETIHNFGASGQF